MTNILREIRLGQRRLEQDPRYDYWFLLQDAVITALEGEQVLELPSDYQRSLDQDSPRIILEDDTPPLRRFTTDQAIFKYQDATGTPEVYVLRGKTVKLYPTPDKEFTIVWPYVRQDQELDTENNVENQWTQFAFTYLMTKAGIAMAQSLRDDAALQNFSADFEVAELETRNDTVAREESNFDQVRGKRNAFRRTDSGQSSR